ncbi:VIT domain-containing protein [Sphingomonas sp. HF-S4]|uniref:VIT domain-containing protein n=1 Tax=Sphingomonas agrestis TaxID=3080540 RepID=A0ABU3YBP2_9SPHN|nr:VIT domain-containing protein [Sphingomonas sp. HF-S4]MDV3458814.1 VIT domain-containing protein [Sphingomonas sp. HF-S4]
MRGEAMGWRATISLAIGLWLLPAPAMAQTNPSLSEAERGIRTDDGEDVAKHLRIDEVLVSAHVTGRTADVTLELLLSADPQEDENFEARLALALPADAVVTGYALSVGDAMIPGQLLEQPKARNLYEDEVRAGIDPGLAEVSGNRFTTRIYPIDRAHPRRFRVTFAAPFDPMRGIVLPLSREGTIGKVSLTVTVDGFAAAPSVRFAGETVTLAKQGAQWRGNAGGDRKRLQGGLEIAGGTLAAPMLVTRHASGESFFAISDTAPAGAARPTGGRLRIYWDRSLSHRDDRRDLEAEVLARLADTTTPDAIDLITFASDRPQWTMHPDAAALRKMLDGVTYRGATSFAGLDALSLPPARRCVLVSDGLVTIDRGAEFAADCPLALLTASPKADGARLGRIARGPLVRVSDGKVAEAVAALAQPTAGVTAIRDSAGRRIAFRTLPAGAGAWQIVGPMPDRGGVRVRLSDGSERSYAAGATVSADAPGALWAAQQVQILGDDPARHQAMVAFARRYQVAGPAMSLLVLERPDQYLRAGIAPPPGFDAEWMGQYRESKQDADEAALDDKRERFEQVLERWAERKDWWKRRFVASARPKPRPEPMAVPAPMAMAPSPPPVSEPAPAHSPSDEDRAVMVTGTRAQVASESAGLAADDVSEAIVTAARLRDVPVARAERATVDTAVKVDLADLIAKRPYILALNAAAPAQRLTVLAEQERAFGSVPSFYFDVAEWFRRKGDTATGESLLLSALELPQADDETRQIVAFRLERDKAHDRAIELAEHIAAANAEFRPQPARDLALALAARGRSRGAAGRADLERAFALLTDAALNPASDDFDGFEVIALMNANALVPDIEAVGGRWTLDPRLVALLDTDVRIVIEWVADDADIDLWVNEPNGERVFYGDQLSSAGGQISNDMTDGYGPEEYAIRRAPQGAYEVRINGYDADRINPNGAGHVLIRLTRNFGRRSEEETLVDVDLAFQQGRDRDEEARTKPIATLRVGR